MANRYYWEFHIIGSNYGNGYGKDCSAFVNEENCEAFSKFIGNAISRLMTQDTLRNPEFLKILKETTEQRKWYEEYQAQKEQDRIKAAEDRKRRGVMERPKINYIPRGLKVDYAEAYGRLLSQEVNFVPANEEDFLYQRRLIERWYKKSVPQLIEMGRPDAAYGLSEALCKAVPQFIFREDIREMLASQRPQLRKLIIGAFAGLVESVRAWNNEEERLKVCALIQEESGRYKDFRGITKTLIGMIPAETFVGKPVEVTREMNDEEMRQERNRKLAERLRLEEEREARSLIPLNQDYEQHIFDRRNITWNCDLIADLMFAETSRIKKLTEYGSYQEAALRFMQLTKSMCLHFVKDEHYNYFDDMYSPEYAVDNLTDLFRQLYKAGKLPKETVSHSQTVGSYKKE